MENNCASGQGKWSKSANVTVSNYFEKKIAKQTLVELG